MKTIKDQLEMIEELDRKEEMYNKVYKILEVLKESKSIKSPITFLKHRKD